MEAKKEKKKKKKGFWASLFSQKPCSCGDSLIVEEDNKPAVACGCGGGEGESENSANTCCGTVTDGIREIKVLGPGCAKCKATYSVIERIVKENHLDVKLTKVDDIAEMMNYNIMTTPAVMIDEIVRLKGHVPSEAEVKALLGI